MGGVQVLTGRIYVACLASYNNGILHGKWIDTSTSKDEMQDEINVILRSSPCPNIVIKDYEAAVEEAGWVADSSGWRKPTSYGSLQHPGPIEMLCDVEDIKPKLIPSAEEWAIHDFEDMPKSMGEYTSLQTIAHFEDFIEENSSYKREDLVAIVEDMNRLDDIEMDKLAGIFDEFSDYSDEAADEMLSSHKVPDQVKTYFDYDAWERDLKIEMHVIDVPSGVAVFYQ